MIADPLRIIHGDCVEVMRGMLENSVDAIVTDPPYDLTGPSRGGSHRTPGNGPAGRHRIGERGGGFMGKTWDATGIAFDPETWRVALRVLKPGGHLLAFGGTRTFHRMTVAIEDAGFEVRDCLSWNYASGFPKSLNVSKDVKWCHCDGASADSGAADRSSTPENGSGQSHRPPAVEQRPGQPRTVADECGPQARGVWPVCGGCGKPRIPRGLGTALKPAWEPIVVARKPLIGTVAENVEKWGTGALNIDGARIGMTTADRRDTEARINTPNSHRRIGAEVIFGPDKPRPDFTTHLGGRWPANVLLDEEAAAMLDEQSGERSSGDTGGASRFFYTAKADKKDRGNGNTHPTVKPVSLMRYIVRLVTPPSGVVLDPFAGSGTTGQAALAEGFRCVLIEKEAEYVEGIQKWRAAMQLGLGFGGRHRP